MRRNSRTKRFIAALSAACMLAQTGSRHFAYAQDVQTENAAAYADAAQAAEETFSDEADWMVEETDSADAQWVSDVAFSDEPGWTEDETVAADAEWIADELPSDGVIIIEENLSLSEASDGSLESAAGAGAVDIVTDVDLEESLIDDAAAEAEDDLPDGLIEEEEPETEDEMFWFEEEVSAISSDIAPDTGNETADADGSGTSVRSARRLLASSTSARSSSTGKTWYGSQLGSLSANAVVFYRALVDYYVTQGGTSLELKVDKSSGLDIDAYAFDVTEEETADDEDSTKTKYTAESESYEAAKVLLRTDVQSAWDAFKYDYPEVYWYWEHHYSFGSKVSRSGGCIEEVTLYGTEPFTGALSSAAAFTAGLSTVADSVQCSADYDQDGEVTDRELVQAAHDYLVDRLYYDSARLSTYKTTGDYSIFTPAAAFMDDSVVGTGVVCEGYAKAFKILCCELGINCVMIPGSSGSSSSVGHMWNAVQLDGVWYLMDVTWDDSKGNYAYFLFAYNTGGDRRSPYARLSADKAKAYTFAYPETSTAAHTVVVSNAALAQCTGYTAYACTDEDGVGYFLKSAEAAETAAGHTDGADGVCTVCGTVMARSEPESESGSGTEQQNESESESGTELQNESESESGTESQSESEQQSENDTDPQTGTERESETKSQSKPENETDTQRETEKQTETQQMTEPSTEASTSTSVQPSTEASTSTAAKPSSETLSETNADSSVEPSSTSSALSVSETALSSAQTEQGGSDAEISTSAPASSQTAAVTVKKTKITALTALGSCKIKVKWKKVKGADGYQIQYSTSKKFKVSKTGSKTVKSGSKKTVTIRNLKKKKVYYFRIRAYRVVNGHRKYSDWSAVKKRKVK